MTMLVLSCFSCFIQGNDPDAIKSLIFSCLEYVICIFCLIYFPKIQFIHQPTSSPHFFQNKSQTPDRTLKFFHNVLNSSFHYFFKYPNFYHNKIFFSLKCSVLSLIQVPTQTISLAVTVIPVKSYLLFKNQLKYILSFSPSAPERTHFSFFPVHLQVDLPHCLIHHILVP